MALRILDVGGGDGTRSHFAYPKDNIEVLDLKTGFDITKEVLPKGGWDILLCNHIIEHLSDPDEFLFKCWQVMEPHTILEISTPNMCSWYNRFLFLFGYVPHSYEVSFYHIVGRAFDWNKEEVGGHLRLFTPLALMQLVRLCGFEVEGLQGEHSTFKCNPIILFIDKLLTHINPYLSSVIRIKCRKVYR